MVSAKWDWNEALKVAKEEKYEDGRFSMLIDLVKEGMLSLSDAAKKAGLSIDEFKKAAMLQH
jgi:predicted HTH domain antitoxin